MFKNVTYFTSILLLSFFSLATIANEQGYESISPAQPTQNPDKVEVIEFFGTAAHIVMLLNPY